MEDMLFSSTKRFVKGYGFLPFAKYIGKILTKNLSGKYSQEILDLAKQSETDGIKTSSKRALQKIAEATSDLIGSKTANKIQRASKKSPKTNSEMSK